MISESVKEKGISHGQKAKKEIKKWRGCKKAKGKGSQ